MEDQLILREMEGWGYRLFNECREHGLGCTTLGVAIRPEPTLEHFDPETLMLRVRDEYDAATEVELGLQVGVTGVIPVCAGQVMLVDRIDKRVDFFTFGGTLLALSTEAVSIYILDSPAPILEMSQNIPRQLAVEVELMMAVFQAEWGLDEEGFHERLAQVAPFDFYLASIGSMLLRFQRGLALRQSYHDLYSALLHEKAWLEANHQWQKPPLTLGQLLSPE